MIVVNLYFVESLVDNIASLNLSDEEDTNLRQQIDPNNELDVKKIFKEWLVPIYKRWGTSTKLKLKESLRYLLNSNDDDLFDLVAGGNEPPFEFPEPLINYFIWLWEVLFGNESYRIENLDEYVVNNQFGTINYLE